ncbi:MAG: tRNA (cytosine(32)/uridine(32)-2'-O)-methyltransferase TrmJ [Gammaproteobacteria bacterium CG_4_10_14_0_8_um_filter_38_16]|nr:MAG: tRNA (cytosine(32)/uridine(32)-2'-O)-methyltransferase TrmJ [Gammaproteobacteria bacterium CG_4_10_14_0_8_um_filter_38_16]PJA03121.1 MAG: tRNA (cytosine(32)/uridine(32)-2'-O)-methyltransferase TrmJ [Gammaproteobacteria bacterium CG_4_10_14_0_2_um_filter_38_22]
MLNRIRIVMIETSHPGNIGAAARAMKAMGLLQLVLVSPQKFPDAEATFRSAGADDLLEQAVVVGDLKEALKNCEWVIGASVRQRKLSRTIYTPKMCAEKIRDELSGNIAIVFGRESSGLSNTELSLCHDQIFIPTNPDFSSLNVASAVQVICYELRMSFLEKKEIELKQYAQDPLATADEVAGFYVHLKKTLLDLHFLDVKQPKRLMERLQLLFNRTHLTITELNILRGILRSIEIKLGTRY